MQRFMLRQRKTTRSVHRTSVRSANRSFVRVRWRAPDFLGKALTAMVRAVRARRRLARLAPQFFDAAVVQREAENRAEESRWRTQWESALLKVYGAEAGIPERTGEVAALPSPRIQCAVERELAELQAWLKAGRVALEKYRRRQPHALPSLPRLARLIQLAHDLGHLALGLDSKNPLPEKVSYDYELTALNRAYGHLDDNSPAANC